MGFRKCSVAVHECTRMFLWDVFRRLLRRLIRPYRRWGPRDLQCCMPGALFARKHLNRGMGSNPVGGACCGAGVQRPGWTKGAVIR